MARRRLGSLCAGGGSLGSRLQGRRRSGVISPPVFAALLVGIVGAGAGTYMLLPRSLPEELPKDLPSVESPSLLALADEALRHGDWRGAEAGYAQVIGADPDSAAAEAGWARALTFQYRFGEAVPHARRAVELAPREPDAHVALALALNWAGDLDGAIAAARRSIDLDPRLADGYALLAESLVDRHQLALAREQLERALALDPSGVEPLRVGAYLLETEGRYEEALDGYRAAIESAPRYAHLHFSLGNVYRALGRADDAALSYRTAANLAPTDARPLTGLGLLHLAREDYTTALSYFEQAAELDSSYSTALGQLGTTYYFQGDFARAQEPLVRVTQIERDPLRLSSYRHVLGWTYLRMGSLDSSEKEFHQALALNPDLAGARQGLAAIATLRGEAQP